MQHLQVRETVTVEADIHLSPTPSTCQYGLGKYTEHLLRKRDLSFASQSHSKEFSWEETLTMPFIGEMRFLALLYLYMTCFTHAMAEYVAP